MIMIGMKPKFMVVDRREKKIKRCLKDVEIIINNNQHKNSKLGENGNCA